MYGDVVIVVDVFKIRKNIFSAQFIINFGFTFHEECKKIHRNLSS